MARLNCPVDYVANSRRLGEDNNQAVGFWEQIDGAAYPWHAPVMRDEQPGQSAFAWDRLASDSG